MEALGATLQKIFFCLKIGTDIASSISDAFGPFLINGVCIPPGSGKTAVIKNLDSESTVFIDLDPEVNQEFDEDDQKKLISNTSLAVSRLTYTKSKDVMQEIQDILKNTSKQIRRFVFVSSDYRLLKYVNCKNIQYFLPSDNLYKKLKENSNFNDDKYKEVKDDLIRRKKDKLQIYLSIEELLSKIADMFKADLKI